MLQDGDKVKPYLVPFGVRSPTENLLPGTVNVFGSYDWPL